MKSHCTESVGFYLEPLCDFSIDFVYVKHQLNEEILLKKKKDYSSKRMRHFMVSV